MGTTPLHEKVAPEGAVRCPCAVNGGRLSVLGSDQLRAALRAAYAAERIARINGPLDHALITGLDGHVPRQPLKLMPASVASQPCHHALVLRWSYLLRASPANRTRSPEEVPSFLVLGQGSHGKPLARVDHDTVRFSEFVAHLREPSG